MSRPVQDLRFVLTIIGPITDPLFQMEPQSERIGVVRPKGRGAPEGVHGFHQLTLVDQDITKIIVGNRIVRLEAKSIAKADLGLVEATKKSKRIAKISVSLRVMRVEPQCLSTTALRLS